MSFRKEGKEYQFNGQTLVLYPISVLSEKLGQAIKSPRTTQTIRKWELHKVIPPAIFRAGQKRLYTMEQIDLICRLAKKHKIKQGNAEPLAKFSNELWEEMRKINRRYLRKRDGND